MSERPQRIAHVLNRLMFGGNENLCLQLIEYTPLGLQHVLFNIDPSCVPRYTLRHPTRRSACALPSPPPARCRSLPAEGETGRLVQAQDADALAVGILELLMHPDTARLLANRAFAQAREHLDIKARAARYYAVLGHARRRAFRG